MASKEFEIVVSLEEAGMRLDKLISKHLPDVSRVKIQKSIKKGEIAVGGISIVEPKYLVRIAEVIRIVIPSDEEPNDYLAPYKCNLSIVYEDENLIVLEKPAGLTVHPGAGNKDKTLANVLVANYGNNLSDISGSFRLGILHRLDKDTSGLMVVAKNNKTHLLLAQQLEARQIERRYLAFVYGMLSPSMGTIKANIGRSKRDRTKMTTLHSGGKHAVTHYEVLKTFGDSAVSLVRCKLETGRTHQIRVHLSFKKHPIIGDKTYLGARNFNLSSLREDTQIAIKSFPRQALHAFSLKFIHPISMKEMVFESNLPEDLAELLKLLNHN